MASQLAAATEIIHLYAASDVMGVPIESVYPSPNEHHVAWNRLVIGRDVHQQSTDIKLLWSAGSTPDNIQAFAADHFTLLYPTVT